MSDESISEPSREPSGEKAQSSNFYVLVFGLVMLVGLLFLAWLGRPPRSVIIGEPLPRIDLQPLLNTSEADYLSKEDLLGKYCVIHFWGTWCPPCLKEFPDFAKLAAEFQNNEIVAIISVSCSPGPEYDLNKLESETEAFLSDYPTPIPTYSDGTALSRQQLALLLPNGSFGYPTTLLVDPEGTIVDALEGYYPGDMEKLSSTLREKLAKSFGDLAR